MCIAAHLIYVGAAMNAKDTCFATPSLGIGPESRRSAVAKTPHQVLQGMWDNVAPELARLSAAMGVSADYVEDVLQDVFVAAWKNCPVGLNLKRTKWWLIRTTVNRCNLLHRHQKRWEAVLKESTCGRSALTTSDSAHHLAIKQEERRLVVCELNLLSPEQRSVLILRYFENYDSKEIGAILGMPDSTVRSHLCNARRMLARGLVKAGYQHEAK